MLFKKQAEMIEKIRVIVDQIKAVRDENPAIFLGLRSDLHSAIDALENAEESEDDGALTVSISRPASHGSNGATRQLSPAVQRVVDYFKQHGNALTGGSSVSRALGMNRATVDYAFRRPGLFENIDRMWRLKSGV